MCSVRCSATADLQQRFQITVPSHAFIFSPVHRGDCTRDCPFHQILELNEGEMSFCPNALCRRRPVAVLRKESLTSLILKMRAKHRLAGIGTTTSIMSFVKGACLLANIHELM
jgi:hypothetical protein